ncbi:MAG: hypothetical protein JKY37_20395 [Nannocystaceae bacterium]|nr:hypothetical protein [Nannocystaceae bacterium]
MAAVEAAVNRGGTEVVALRGGTEVVEVEAVEAAMGQLDAVEADRTEVDGDRTDVVRMEVDGVRVPLPPVSGLPELSPMVVAEAKGGAWWLRVAVVVAAGFAVWLIWPRGTAVKSGEGGGVEAAVSEAQAHDGARVVGASTDVKPRAEVAPANVGPPQLQTPPSPASVGGTDAEVEQAPDVEPTPREPRPSSPTGTEPVDAIVQKPPEARPTSPAVDCDGVVANANAAADRRAWAKVYTATSRKKRRCWASRSAYRVLRVQSALRTEHFAECVSVAGDDPAVARERRRCMTKMDSK